VLVCHKDGTGGTGGTGGNTRNTLGGNDEEIPRGVSNSTLASLFNQPVNGPGSGGVGERSTPNYEQNAYGYPFLIGPQGQENGGKTRAIQSFVPGDLDLIPNPFKSFSPASYSPKTEPVPYLNDFSAFKK
jgi:hypothetical protein